MQFGCKSETALAGIKERWQMHFGIIVRYHQKEVDS